MKSVGSKPDALLPPLNHILAKYPDFSNGYLMRLGALCEGNDRPGISSDINNALKYLATSRVGNTSQGSLLSMRAKIEHANGNDRAAIDDLDRPSMLISIKPSSSPIAAPLHQRKRHRPASDRTQT